MLNVVQNDEAELIGHFGLVPGQSAHFSGPHDMITQSFENSRNSVFVPTLEPHIYGCGRRCGLLEYVHGSVKSLA